MQVDSTIFEEITRFESDSLTLEGRISYPASIMPACAVLIAGAHPLLGGREENNVVDAVRHGVARTGALTMTFNYRGVGNSEKGNLDWQRMIADFWREGRVSEEACWQRDTENAIDHLSELIDAPLVLIGYSFGCWVVSRLVEANAPLATICISPNPNQHDLSGLDSQTSPILVISSDNDFSCSPDDMRRWLESRTENLQHRLIPGAEHFFRARESEVVAETCAFLAANRILVGPA